MKTIMIATVGSRDIKLKNPVDIEGLNLRESRNGQPAYELTNPRDGGKLIQTNFNAARKEILIPMLEPALNYAIAKNNRIDELYLVVTDQDVSVEYSRFDSIFLGKVIKSYLSQSNRFKRAIGRITLKPVRNNLTYIDSMYDFMDKMIKSILSNPENTNSKLFVFPQGGIDAINHSLTLKSIEYFDDVDHLTKPENLPHAIPLTFPAKFRRNFTKQTVLKFLEQCDYSGIISLNYSPEVNTLASVGNALVNFDYQISKQYLARCFQFEKLRAYAASLQDEFNHMDKDFNKRLKLFYQGAKIRYMQKAYTAFILKVFTINENILKPYAEKFLGGTIVYNSGNKHKEWKNLIERKPEIKAYLANYVINDNNTMLKYDEPNRIAYKAIIEMHKEHVENYDNLEVILRNLNLIANLRNKAAHELKGIEKESINNALEKTNTTIDELIQRLDAYFKVDGNHLFNDINKIISTSL